MCIIDANEKKMKALLGFLSSELSTGRNEEGNENSQFSFSMNDEPARSDSSATSTNEENRNVNIFVLFE